MGTCEVLRVVLWMHGVFQLLRAFAMPCGGARRAQRPSGFNSRESSESDTRRTCGVVPLGRVFIFCQRLGVQRDRSERSCSSAAEGFFVGCVF